MIGGSLIASSVVDGVHVHNGLTQVVDIFNTGATIIEEAFLKQ